MRDLRLEPKKIRGREDVWWYEDGHGIQIVLAVGDPTLPPIRIPWKQLLDAAKRAAPKRKR